MSEEDIRWIQRAQNYEKAFLRLKEAMEMETLNELERNGLTQRFEFTIDLAWKVMKDYLDYKGFNFKPSPKDTIRLAQESEFIDYAQSLMDGLEIRNILSHDYDGVSTATVSKLQNEFIESSLPYRIDLVDFTRLTNQEFIDHINRVGIPFYKQGELVELT